MCACVCVSGCLQHEQLLHLAAGDARVLIRRATCVRSHDLHGVIDWTGPQPSMCRRFPLFALSCVAAFAVVRAVCRPCCGVDTIAAAMCGDVASLIVITFEVNAVASPYS